MILEIIFGMLMIGISFIHYSKRYGKASPLTTTFTSDLKMVMVVRSDLKMGTGKVAAQCCHACLGLYKAQVKKDLPRLQAWEKSAYKKVVLKCNSENDMLKIAEVARSKKLEYYIVRDAGRTQIAPGSKTVLSIGPATEEELNEVTNYLKLL